MMVPVFTASLLPSKEPSKNELSNNERAFENQKTLRKFEICYGQPILESKSPRSDSYSDSSSRSTSYDSSSCSSKSPRSRSPASYKPTCSRSRIHHSKSPVSKRTRRSSSRSPTSIRSCLKSPATKPRSSKSLVSKSSSRRAIAKYSSSSPPRPSCLKQSSSKYSSIRSPVPRKSCLRSSASKSLVKKSLQLRPPCLKNPSSLSQSNQSACNPGLITQTVTFSKSKPSNSKPQVPRLSRLESCQSKSLKPHSAFKSPISKNPPPFNPNKSQYKLPFPKAITFKSVCARQSRSPASPPPTKSSASSKTPSYKTANSKSNQSSSPQSYPPSSKSPGRSPSPRATVPTLDFSRCLESPFPKNSRVVESNRPYFKPEIKRPKLTVSKLCVRSRLSQGVRFHDGRQKPRSLLGFYDHRRTDQTLKYRLSRHLNKNMNREYIEKSLTTKMDVRYMTELKNYFDRIRGTLTCGSPECPALQERFKKHLMDHHGGQGPRNMQREEKVAGSEAQTKITLANLGGFTISLERRPTSTTNSMQNAPYVPTGMPPNAPNAPINQSILDVVNRHKMGVDSELRRWIKKIPTREETPADEQRKKVLVHNFIDKVIALDLSKRDRETEYWLRKEIDDFLDSLNMWYPGSNSDRRAFKDGLRENLIERLVHQNERFIEDLRNVEDNNRNNTMVNNSTQNYPGNGPNNFANNGTQPYDMYETPTYGSNGTQNYVYSGTQPFGTYGLHNYGRDGIQNVANDRNSQQNLNQPYRNKYTGTSIHSESEAPYYNETQSLGNYGPQSHVGDGTQTHLNGVPSNSQSNSRLRGQPSPRSTEPRGSVDNYSNQPYANMYTKSNNGYIKNGSQVGATQNSDNKGPITMVIDKYGNLVSYGPPGTSSNGFNKAPPNLVPSGMQNQSNQSYNPIEPTQSRLLNNIPNNGITRNDNPSSLSNLSRNASKNLNQSKPGIRIADYPTYENNGYAPDNVGQPRKPSLKSVSNSSTNYENEETAAKDPTLRLGLDPTTQRNPITGLRPHNIEPKNLHSLNYPNSLYNSDIVNKLQIATTDNRRPLRNTTYESSYGNIGEYIETCNRCKKYIHPISYSDTNVKCTVKSREICICPHPNAIVKRQKACCGREIDLETEISDWLQKCTFIRYDGLMNKHEIIDALILQITPYLSQPSSSLNKAVLKAKIMNVLRGLGVCSKTDYGMRNVLVRLANELANRLIGIVSRLECSGATNWKCSLLKNRPFKYTEQVHVGPNEVNREDLKHDLLQEFEYCVHGTKLEYSKEILELISELVIDRIELIRRNADETVKIDMKQILESANVLNKEEITNIINSMLKYTREICIMIASTNNRTDTAIIARPCISVRSVYTSEHEVTPNFEGAAGSSTPRRKKEVSKLSPEENEYTDKISFVIREWLKTVPKYFQNLDDNNMTEVMIFDLAGSIADYTKLGQLIATEMDTKQYMSYYVYSWLLKFEIVDEIRQTKPYVQALVTKLQEIEVPNMTRSQHGTRQAMHNIRYQEADAPTAWSDSFVPKGQDILQDEISIWMNEYPSQIYVNKDKSTQNKLVHDFAENLQKHKKDDNEEILKEIKSWLGKVVNSEDKEMIDMMSKNLQNRINILPRDETIAAMLKQRKEDRRMPNKPDLPVQISQNVSQDESDKTMQEFIVKYVEYNFDEDDPLAKRAYAKLLRHELQRLEPNVLKQIYEGSIEKFSAHNLFMELGYIKDISDWLKTLPLVDENYHRIGNTDRVEFCINLAKEITTVDAERNQSAMNYDQYIATIITQFMGQLRFKLDKNADITEYVHSLFKKIAIRRIRGEAPRLSPDMVWSNIADFLDDYIKLNGQDIANDEVKLEVWAARLVQEIKKMIKENPSALATGDVIDRLAQVTKPGDETIKRFNHELDYAKEISDWLKNLPLVNLENEEAIEGLAEKMAEYENNVDDRELVLYIKQWISKLPLDKNKQIDVPFAIQQLLNRRKKVIEVKDNKSLPVDQSVKQNSTSVNTIHSGAKTECRGCCPVDDPGFIIIQVIKEWCDDLPFIGREEDIKNVKNYIKGKLYQKLIEINDNTRMTRNDLLFIELLSDKVGELLGNIPNNLKLELEKDKLKTELLDKVKQARMFYKDVTLGDEYMKDLEDAIEIVLPNPSPQAEVNPGFEAYKENLAEKFILGNFDHGNDADKLKYEQIMDKEVNKFASSAQQRTVLPIQEEKLNNDIMSTLFDVNMPDEKAMIDNVEEIKTKCEIQSWFGKLPLKPVSGEAELLDRDLKVSLLARKIHILEFEKDPDEKVHKEITKWLGKVPLSAGKIDDFAINLQEILKSTRKSRKCVKASDVDIGKSRILSGSFTDQDAENSIWVNPNTTTESGNKIKRPPRLKTGDILIDIVEKWSDNIPLPPLPNNQLQIIKGDLRTKLYKKISELNSTNVFDNDQMYNYLLGEEIAQGLAALPQSDALIQSQYPLQCQLISAIESIKPLIREERELHEYKKFVEDTVSSILGSPKNPTTEEKLLLSKIQEEVVDDFIEYKYNKDNDEGKQFYKNKIVDALTEYNSIGEKEENRNEIVSDTLVEVNKMICELDKIPPPDEPALQEEVEESRMKHEVDNFLNNVAPADQVPSNIHRNSLRDSLAKQLHELEKTGHSEDNDQKMEDAVNRTLKKLDAEDKKEAVKPFLEKLKKNEGIRRPGYRDSPSKALRLLMQEQMLMQERHAPNNSASLDPQGMQVQVDASVYRPDFIQLSWKPPTPPPPDTANPDLLVVLPRQSLPPSPGPIGSGLLPSVTHHTITQPTQTPVHMTGLTQTSSSPHGSQRMRIQSPWYFHPEPRPVLPQPQYDPRFVPPIQSPTRSIPGQVQMGPRLVPGQTQMDPRWAPGQFDPRFVPGQGQFVPQQSSNAGIESEMELFGDECLCDFCKSRNRCPYFDRESCEDYFPMMCRHPMMPIPPMMPSMPMPFPSMMMPPAFMYC